MKKILMATVLVLLLTATLNAQLCELGSGLSYNVKPNEKLEPFVSDPGGFTPVIPIGLGVNLTYSGIFNFGVELGARYAFSDNIDGYSSAYSQSNDMYYILNFIFTYKIRTGENGLPTFKMTGRR